MATKKKAAKKKAGKKKATKKKAMFGRAKSWEDPEKSWSRGG